MGAPHVALLHLCDSLFPVGAFAHSDGLEGAVASGEVRSPADVSLWLRATTCEVVGTLEGPAVREAMAATDRADRQALAELSADLEAMRACRSGREASRAMGTRLLKTWQRVRPSHPLDQALAAGTTAVFPVAFGMVAAVEHIEVTAAIEGYGYLRLASAVSAAMRLVPLGQLDAHGALGDVLLGLPALAARVAVSAAPPRSFVPLMDIAAMRHQHVHSRLFRS